MSDELYTHPTVRSMNIQELQIRLEGTRSRRLAAALEFQHVTSTKLEKRREHTDTRFLRTYDALDKKLIKITEMLNQADKALAKLAELDGELTLIESDMGENDRS